MPRSNRASRAWPRSGGRDGLKRMHRWIATVLLAGGSWRRLARQRRRTRARVAPESKPFALRVLPAHALGPDVAGPVPGGTGEVVDLATVAARCACACRRAGRDPRPSALHALTRGPRFFDAARDFPEVTVHLRSLSAALLRTGGTLHGQLRMHGIERRERFVLAPGQVLRAPARLRHRRAAASCAAAITTWTAGAWRCG
jgi:hypothetical protein